MPNKRKLLVGWVASTLSLVVVISFCLNGGSIQAAQAPTSSGESQAESENTDLHLWPPPGMING
jgi:hypothetical protein